MREAFQVAPGRLAVLAAGALALAACKGDRITAPMTLGGATVAAATLDRGRVSFTRNCTGCHGDRGDGKAPTSATLKPRPRDFTRGLFKFKSTPDDSLPLDGDLRGTLQRGLRGTHMPSWANLSPEDLEGTIQYIKTFSPRWRRERPGAAVPRPDDPWAGKRLDAVARGEAVYHAVARCWECHPAYVSRQRIMELARQEAERRGKRPPTSLPFRGALHRSAMVDTSYGRETAPDFIADQLRVAWADGLLYRTVAAGVGGTPMPTWHGRLGPSDLWAVVHFVRDLIQIKGTPRAKALRRSLDST